MELHILKQIILQQHDGIKVEDAMLRDIFEELPQLPGVVILSGIRRCGKSTVLQQLRQHLPEKDYYLNFDDERLIHFTVDDFHLMMEILVELYGEQHTCYFDEIQNITGWERFIRRLHNEGYKVYITGSNANLLSRELGTHLTGRHIQVELYPFSFREFLKFNGITYTDKDFYTTKGVATFRKYFDLYIQNGGFPEYLKSQNAAYLSSLYESILYRDIMVRNQILNEKEIKELGFFIASNVARPITYNSLKNIIQVKHVNTVKNYLQYFEDTYLIYLVNKFDYSLKKQMANPKKVYFVDSGLAHQINFSFSKDRGRYLENIVFLELNRNKSEIYYHKGLNECDFLIRKGNQVVEAIQVSVSLQQQETRERELAGIKEAMQTYQLKTGVILTENEEEMITSEDGVVKILPVWKWLLGSY
jgi:predicted AAA+ superfamily ATPase